MSMDANSYNNPMAYEQAFGQPLLNLNVDASIAGNDDMFNFNSTASSPNLPRDLTSSCRSTAR